MSVTTHFPLHLLHIVLMSPDKLKKVVHVMSLFLSVHVDFKHHVACQFRKKGNVAMSNLRVKDHRVGAHLGRVTGPGRGQVEVGEGVEDRGRRRNR